MVEHIPIEDSVTTVDPFGPHAYSGPHTHRRLHTHLTSCNLAKAFRRRSIEPVPLLNTVHANPFPKTDPVTAIVRRTPTQWAQIPFRPACHFQCEVHAGSPRPASDNADFADLAFGVRSDVTAVNRTRECLTPAFILSSYRHGQSRLVSRSSRRPLGL